MTKKIIELKNKYPDLEIVVNDIGFLEIRESGISHIRNFTVCKFADYNKDTVEYRIKNFISAKEEMKNGSERVERLKERFDKGEHILKGDGSVLDFLIEMIIYEQLEY